MQLPCVHLNGSSRNSLVEQQCAVADVLRNALNEMANAAPNQRDYYPLGDIAFATAKAEHIDRARRVQDVLNEVEELAESISKQ